MQPFSLLGDQRTDIIENYIVDEAGTLSDNAGLHNYQDFEWASNTTRGF